MSEQLTLTTPMTAERESDGRMAVLGVLGVVWLVSVDWLTTLSLGGISVSGALTILTAGGLLAVSPTLVPRWLGRPRSWEAQPSPWPMLLFSLVAIVALCFNVNSAGLQNVCVYLGFILGIAVVSDAARPEDVQFWTRALTVSAAVVTVVFLVNHFLKLEIYGDRSFALSAMICLALCVPQRESRIARYLPLLVIIAAILSLSRTATLVCLGILLFIVVRAQRVHRKWLALFTTLVVVTLPLLLYQVYAPFRDRFTEGDAAVSVGGTAFNTSGRTKLWAVTYESALKSPLFGQGPGSTGELIEAHFPGTGHPHNDYLRLFHDFGLLGVSLWTLGLLYLLWQAAHRARSLDRPIDWAAMLCIFGILTASITDNVIVYPFVMIPAGIVIGLSRAQALGTSALAPYHAKEVTWS